MQKGFSAIIVIILGLLILAGLGSGGYYFYQQQKLKSITDFESCAKIYPVMTSYPAQCNTPDGRHFVQQLSEEEKRKLVPPTDPTSDWKSYENKKFGFSFKYPSEATISSELSDQFGNSVSVKSKNLELTVAVDSTKLYDSGEINTDEMWEVVVGGSKWKAQYYKENKCTSPCLASTTLSKNARDLSITFTFSGPRPSKDEINNYLSTFKLLNDETANWKTYQNKVDKYSLEIPKDFEVIEGNYATELGSQIEVYVSDVDPGNCRGDCPFVESTEWKLLGKHKYFLYKGYFGSMNGTPQSYISLVKSLKNKFMVLTLRELGNNLDYFEEREPGSIAEGNVKIFERIAASLEEN